MQFRVEVYWSSQLSGQMWQLIDLAKRSISTSAR